MFEMFNDLFLKIYKYNLDFCSYVMKIYNIIKLVLEIFLFNIIEIIIM